MNKLFAIAIAGFVVLCFISPVQVEAAPLSVISIQTSPTAGKDGVLITVEAVPGAVRYAFMVDNNTEFGGTGMYYINEYHDTPVVDAYMQNIPKFYFDTWAFDASGKNIAQLGRIALNNPNYVVPSTSTPAPVTSSSAPAVVSTPSSKPAVAASIPAVSSSVSTTTSTESTSTTSSSETSTSEASTLTTAAVETRSSNATPEQVLAVTLIGGGSLGLGAAAIYFMQKAGWLAKLFAIFGK